MRLTLILIGIGVVAYLMALGLHAFISERSKGEHKKCKKHD